MSERGRAAVSRTDVSCAPRRLARGEPLRSGARLLAEGERASLLDDVGEVRGRRGGVAGRLAHTGAVEDVADVAQPRAGAGGELAKGRLAGGGVAVSEGELELALGLECHRGDA